MVTSNRTKAVGIQHIIGMSTDGAVISMIETNLETMRNPTNLFVGGCQIYKTKYLNIPGSVGCTVVVVNSKYALFLYNKCKYTQKILSSQSGFINENCWYMRGVSINTSQDLSYRAFECICLSFGIKDAKVSERYSGSQFNHNNIKYSAKNVVAGEAGNIWVA
ncbi:MAG: hypothetical protein ACP5RT_00380 [Candidatus Micrarchaeia archaeon]